MSIIYQSLGARGSKYDYAIRRGSSNDYDIYSGVSGRYIETVTNVSVRELRSILLSSGGSKVVKYDY